MPVINQFGIVAQDGVPYAQRITNIEQSRNVNETPPVDTGPITPPVQTSTGKPSERGDTGHSGGGWLASMRRIFWPGQEKVVTAQEPYNPQTLSAVMAWDRRGIEGGGQPTKIARRNVVSMNLNAGLTQHGFTQHNYRAFLPPPVIHWPMRGTRSVSGIVGRMGSADTMHVPGVFVPRQIS